MTYPLFDVDPHSPDKRKPGAYWFLAAYGPDGDQRQYFLDHLASDEYRRDWAEKRAPIAVCLPGGSWWPIDAKCSGSDGPGWTITGEPPNLTAHPSINAEGSYHGWLQNGVLSEDLEGRASKQAAAP
jgi:hypothetical protein